MDDDAVLISGISSIGYWCHLAFPVLAPRSYVNTSYFATLGYAFPTGLGAKVGNPHRQVVAVTGDGGFMYALPDLATAVQEGINTVTVVFNDGALGASLRDQQVRYKGRVIGTRMQKPQLRRNGASLRGRRGQVGALRPVGAGPCRRAEAGQTGYH